MSIAGDFKALYHDAPLLRPAVGWLRREGTDPEALARDAIARLRRRGRELPRPNRTRYIAQVILGEFCARWHRRHGGRSVASLRANPELEERELKPFLLAVIAAGDARAFRRVTPRMARQSALEPLMDLGSPEDFIGFVGSNADQLADRFLANFDSSWKDAAQRAVSYLEVTAVSAYLTRRTRPIKNAVPNLGEYLRSSKRLSPRTVIAMKLAYLPALLTAEERRSLLRDYGWDGPFRQCIPIKTIAERLDFKNADALYRKLFRVRGWCRSYIDTRSGGPT